VVLVVLAVPVFGIRLGLTDPEPQAAETDDLVHRLRDDVIDPTATATGIDIHSGGPAALGIDMADKVSGRLPLFFGMVMFFSFLLLMAAFRSLLVPLKAAVMNVLAIGASFGVLVAVFQWGWGTDVIGVGWRFRSTSLPDFIPVVGYSDASELPPHGRAFESRQP